MLFVNQVSGLLFLDLVEEVCARRSGVQLITGECERMIPSLVVDYGPKYNRKNIIWRFYSWVIFFVYAFVKIFLSDKKNPILFVSNPPIICLIGLVMKKVRGQRFSVLVYDVYPDVLVNLNRLRRGSIIEKWWHTLNKHVFKHAECVYTIGPYMASNLSRYIERELGSKVKWCHLWADTNSMQPIAKSENILLRKLGWSDRKIVMYSGNFGNSHKLDALIEVLADFKCRSDVGFVFMGGGPYWEKILDFVSRNRIDNCVVLPWQPAEAIADSLAAADISVVSLDLRLSGLMIPSKIFNSLAIGAAILGLVGEEGNEVADLIRDGKCGLIANPDDKKMIRENLEFMLVDDEKLSVWGLNARKTCVTAFGRRNCQVLAGWLLSDFYETRI